MSAQFDIGRELAKLRRLSACLEHTPAHATEFRRALVAETAAVIAEIKLRFDLVGLEAARRRAEPLSCETCGYSLARQPEVGT